MKKKSLLIYIIIFVVCFIGGFIYGMVNQLYGTEAQEKKLHNELVEIAKVLSTEDDYTDLKVKLNQTVTTGATADKEKKAKEYFSQVVNLVEGFMTIQDINLETILTFDNFIQDRPNFTNSLNLIDSTYEKTNNFIESYNELLDEDYIKQYIDDEDIINYIGPEKSKKVMKIIVDPMFVNLDKMRDIIVFLKDNNSNWYIEDDVIYFATDEQVAEYNRLLGEL